MKFLIIGDPHFKNDNASETNQMIEEIYKLLEKNKYDKIVILGDILDTHEKINLRPFFKATNFIMNLSKITTVYVLIGNHDRMNNNIFLTEEHPFYGLKNKDNIFIIDKVFKENNLLFVPYVPTGRFAEALKTIQYKEEEVDIIFAHQEFENSIFSNQGDLIPENVSIYSGHIHNHIKIKNLTYVGTPFQHSFYDNPDKFILELNNSQGSIKEKKIYLNIIKKRIQEITVPELMDYKIDENYITKLLIKGDQKKLNNIKIQDILKHPNIRYKLILDKKNSFPKEIKEFSFNYLLEKRLQEEKLEIQNLYKRIKNQKFSSSSISSSSSVSI